MATSLILEIEGYKVNLLKELGAGSFGIVYEAVDEDSVKIAAKKLHKFDSKEKDIYQKIKSISIKGTSENIVKIYDVLVSPLPKAVWIFMEYGDLGDLDQYFKKTDPLPDLKARHEFMIQIAWGILFLHTNNIVHRDIKPVNIILQSNKRSGPVCKLADFGLIKILDPNMKSSALYTKTGTRAFRAPEFCDENKIRYHRDVDIFAAGLTYLAMLQAKPNSDLIPKIPSLLDKKEYEMTIGKLMYERQKNKQPDVIVVEDDGGDDELSLIIKCIIRKMSALNPKERLSALDLTQHLHKETLEDLHSSLGIDKMNPNEEENLAAGDTGEQQNNGKQIHEQIGDITGSGNVAEPGLDAGDGPSINQELARKQVNLHYKDTLDVGLGFWGSTKFCVMSNGTLVIQGTEEEGDEPALHIYSRNGDKIDTKQPLCEHKDIPINIASLMVEAINYLAVSCADCHTIRLLNIETSDVVVAYQNKYQQPSYMCVMGSMNRLYVVERKEGRPVLTLDTTTIPFKYTAMLTTDLEAYYTMCVMPDPYQQIAISTDRPQPMIRTLSLIEHEIEWEMKGDLEGKLCKPTGIVYSPNHDVIIATDEINARLLVVSPSDGKCLLCIKVTELQNADIYELALHLNELIVLFMRDRKVFINYYEISSFSNIMEASSVVFTVHS